MNTFFELRSIALTAVLFACACSGGIEPALGSHDTHASPTPTELHLTDDALIEQGLAEPAGTAELTMQPSAPIAWQLLPSQSYLSLISIKQTDIAEVHTFNRFNATIDQTGEAAVTIDLASIATNSDLRDQRLRDHLFEVGSFPQASVKLQLDLLTLDAIQVGEMVTRNVSATLDLHGVTQEVTADVTVVRISANQINVQTKKPIVLNAADFNMSTGLKTLIELANLVAISTAVPVEFMMSFHSTTTN
jgi:polyisoprenoid-binding protein YceI